MTKEIIYLVWNSFSFRSTDTTQKALKVKRIMVFRTQNLSIKRPVYTVSIKTSCNCSATSSYVLLMLINFLDNLL